MSAQNVGLGCGRGSCDPPRRDLVVTVRCLGWVLCPWGAQGGRGTAGAPAVRREREDRMGCLSVPGGALRTPFCSLEELI